MATYKNREVTILQEVPYTGSDKLVISYRDPNMGTEVVSKGAVEFTQDEIDNLSKAEKQRSEDRQKSFDEQIKAKEDEKKRRVDLAKEKDEAKKKGLPENAYLKNKRYHVGEQVTVDGVVYSSRTPNNQGNAPSEKSEFWTVITPPDESQTARISSSALVPAPITVNPDAQKTTEKAKK